MVICALFPSIPGWFSRILGFQLTSNFVLFLAVILLMVLLFFQTIQISKQKEAIKDLIQEVSMVKKDIREDGDKRD